MTRPTFEATYDAAVKEHKRSANWIMRQNFNATALATLADSAVRQLVATERTAEIAYTIPGKMDVVEMNRLLVDMQFKPTERKSLLDFVESHNRAQSRFIQIDVQSKPFEFNGRVYRVQERFNREERQEGDTVSINGTRYYKGMDYGRIVVAGLVEPNSSDSKPLPLAHIRYLAGFGQMDGSAEYPIEVAEVRVAVPLVYPDYSFGTGTTIPTKQDMTKLEEMFTALRDDELEIVE